MLYTTTIRKGRNLKAGLRETRPVSLVEWSPHETEVLLWPPDAASGPTCVSRTEINKIYVMSCTGENIVVIPSMVEEDTGPVAVNPEPSEGDRAHRKPTDR